MVDPSGIIVTNRHVIENAYEFMVTLQDGTTTNARLLGKGFNFDLAILKIDVGRPLPAIKVGNSDEVHVGDRVSGDPQPARPAGHRHFRHRQRAVSRSQRPV